MDHKKSEMKLHKDIILETPQLIPPLSTDVIASGINDCLQHLNSATVVEKYDEDATLYTLTLKGLGYYFIHNSNRALKDRIEYFVRFREIDLDPSLSPSKAMRQVLVWRNHKTSIYSAGVAKKVFWEHLFPRYKCIASDNQQTEKGQAFWSTVVGDALNKKLRIRIINTNDKTFVDVTTKKAFDAEVPKTWGTTKWFQRMIVVIFE